MQRFQTGVLLGQRRNSRANIGQRSLSQVSQCETGGRSDSFWLSFFGDLSEAATIMHKTAEVVRVGTRRIKSTLLTNVIRTILPSEKLELNGYQHLMELEDVCRGTMSLRRGVLLTGTV
jgi:hypothetical protein